MTDPHVSLRDDEHLGTLVEEHGELSIETADDFFQRFVTSVLRQQVSMASAAATRKRLFDAVTMTPEGLLDADDETLRDAGLSRQKTDYVNNIARAFLDEGYSVDYFADHTDEEVIDELSSIKGVGEWTAHMQLMFSLGRADVFPVGDLGIRKGMHALVDPDLTRAEMVEHSECWAPHRSYASLYLWRVSEPIEESVAEVRQA